MAPLIDRQGGVPPTKAAYTCSGDVRISSNVRSQRSGTYVVEFKMADGALAISIPASETRVVRYFQERMPYGLFVPDIP